MAIRILLADDHTILRQGVRLLLEREADLEVVAETDNGLDAVRLAQGLTPDVVVLDISMPQLNGLEATRLLRGEGSPVKILILSMYSDKRFILEALQAGANGFLPKDCMADELVTAVREILRNQHYLGSQISGDIIADYLRMLKNTESSAFTLLTPRERQVLQQLAEGHTSKAIAASLGVSVKTVETYRQQIMDKLGLHSVAELTKYAIREGLTSLEK